MTARDRVIAKILEARIPVTGTGLLYADENGTMPIYDVSDLEPAIIADTLAPLILEFVEEALRGAMLPPYAHLGSDLYREYRADKLPRFQPRDQVLFEAGVAALYEKIAAALRG